MPRSYAPTINPEEVIRRKDGTEVPTNAPGSTDSLHVSLDLTDPAVLAREFPEYNPATNEPTGRTLTVGAVFAGYFSYVHHQQLLRDQARDAQP